MEKRNSVFIACSLDGYIADKNGDLDWLYSVSNPDRQDMGYGAFMERIDALVMGRHTFEKVCSFDCDWPYKQPVFVLSSSMPAIPEKYKDKAKLVNGSLEDVLGRIHQMGLKRLYVDGGNTIQGFLREDLIDEMIITVFPILLGGGSPLFSGLPKEVEFKLKGSTVFLGQLVQNHFQRVR
ncbi:MAG: dihydrofolate reductase [Arenibacter sp.]|nr:dihydrofolate reductase [Arenibacter sp.]